MNLSKEEEKILRQAIKIMETKCSVAITASEHFLYSLNTRKFPLNVLFRAIIKSTYLEVGKTQEVYLLNKQRATVEIKKVSENEAVLLTGWSGVRNNIRTKSKIQGK